MKLKVLPLIVFVLFVNSVTSEDHKFYPNLPAGPYRLNFKGISRCPLSTKKLVQFNYYLSKKSATVTEIKGNATALELVDDSLDLEFKLTVKDSIGGWKDNAYQYKSPYACTTLKNFLGKVWTPFMGGLGIIPTKCPISVGTYIATGADTALIMESNFPKTFFYGTYKIHFIFSKDSVYHGCSTFIVEIKRPWEKD